MQAVAARTGRYAPAPADFLSAFGTRLMALARSHDVLIGAGWEDAPLPGVVEGELAAYVGEAGHITVEGIPVLLAANLVVTVSLAFHELATNAAKHGALSVPGGRVDVAWTVAPAGRRARSKSSGASAAARTSSPQSGAASGRSCWNGAWRPAPRCGWTTSPKGWSAASPYLLGRVRRAPLMHEGTTPRAERPRRLRASSVGTVVRLLSEHGLSAKEVERGMDYAEATGAGTICEGFMLAMSRVHLTDAQLAAGVRFPPWIAKGCHHERNAPAAA